MGHLHLPLLLHHKKEDIPKGCLPVEVGEEGHEERFMVPVGYFNHPLFMQLLKVAEEEYGFDQKGTLRLPCHVAHFRNVQGLIHRESTPSSAPYHHHNSLIVCFKA